jgi:hypothetical protein
LDDEKSEIVYLTKKGAEETSNKNCKIQLISKKIKKRRGKYMKVVLIEKENVFWASDFSF